MTAANPIRSMKTWFAICSSNPEYRTADFKLTGSKHGMKVMLGVPQSHFAWFDPYRSIQWFYHDASDVSDSVRQTISLSARRLESTLYRRQFVDDYNAPLMPLIYKLAASGINAVPGNVMISQNRFWQVFYWGIRSITRCYRQWTIEALIWHTIF